jgi:hypothetical protein
MGECEFCRIPRIGHGEQGDDDLRWLVSKGTQGQCTYTVLSAKFYEVMGDIHDDGTTCPVEAEVV